MEQSEGAYQLEQQQLDEMGPPPARSLRTNVMLDVETMGIGPNAAMLSIAAATFDPYGTGVMESFHAGIELESAVLHGGVVTPSTIAWWMHEDREHARRTYAELHKADIESVLYGFSTWYGSQSIPTWANSPTFDCAIVRSAMERLRMPCPWHYGHERDLRTVRALTRNWGSRTVAHDALADVTNQVTHLQEIIRASGLTP